MTFKGISVWLITAIFFMYEFMLRTIIGTFQHPIMHDLHIDNVEFALISTTSYQVIYGLMQVPAGIIVDKFGLKLSLVFACFICFIAAFGFSHSHGTQTAIFYRVLMGFGSSFGFVAMLVAVYDWLPASKSALFIGVSQFVGTIGPMTAAGPVRSLSEHSSLTWRNMFFDLSIVAIVLGIIIAVFVKNNRDTSSHGYKFLHIEDSIKTNLGRIFRQRQTWYIAFYSALVYVFIEYISENDGIAFLISKGFTASFAAYCISIAWLGYAVGCPLLGLLSDLSNRRKSVMVFAAALLLVSLVSIIYLPIGAILIGVMFFFFGVASGGQSVGFAIMAEQCQQKYLAAGLGFNNAMITVISGGLAPALGHFIQSNASNPKQPSLEIFQQAYVLPVILSIAAIIISSYFIKETYGKSARKPVVLNY